MSTKPAAPGAAGAPRLLLYVPDHRPPLYVPPDHCNHNHTLFYKPETQTDSELRPYVKDNRQTQRIEHMVAKDQSIVEYSDEGPRQASIDADVYKRSLPEAVSNVQPVLIHQNQLVESVRREGTNGVSKESPSDKNYLNYQLLEQSVSHQSIVNQSISILNQQVGVNKVCDEGTTPQLVRTADGMVLAVLPQTAPPLSTVETQELSSRLNSDILTISVPLGWRRIISGSSVIYISPSGSALSTLPQLRDYLQTTGTCKCGLPCPLRPETIFNFDPKVLSKPYQEPTAAEQTKLCNHKRKLLATLSARGQSPATTPPPPPHQQNVEKKGVNLKKMKKRPGFSANMSVSQMMVQRERPFSEFKAQDVDHRHTTSPSFNRVNQQCVPYPQSTPINVSQDDHKPDSLQRSSHYLTVSSGWIMHKDGKHCPNPSSEVASSGIGIPVLGTNGQVIGMQTTTRKNLPTITDQNVTEEKKDTRKKDENQVFCGLNQALTPEVMQKINEQQQLFIQQNQKQIELAMKGYKTQIESDCSRQTQIVSQGQLVIQNGAVVKTNPAKTPPWQVKRNDTMTSPSPKSQKSDSMDFDEPNANLSEDSTNSSSSFQSENMNQMCSRVPPLPQHYNMMNQQWTNQENNKKKAKTTKGKKKASPENKCMTFDNGVRTMQDVKNKCEDLPSNNVPSFMEDPSGYLAQQTVLLNNTISRQVGLPSYDNKYENYPQSVKKISKSGDLSNVFRNSSVIPNPTASPSNTPDSSVLSDKTIDVPPCCKGCNVNKTNIDSYSDNQMRRNYMKQNIYPGASPKHSFEDNPVTSSTYIDRNSMIHDSCGPIQAGTVSTSNFSPIENLPPPEPSPTPSNSSRNTDTPQSNGSHGSQQGTFPAPVPYLNPGLNREFSNPPTPGNGPYPYNSPVPPNTQMMHFISNHNVNKNLMEVDNISMVGVKPAFKQDFNRKQNSMPGYCPPPHLGGGPPQSLVQACYIQTFITTMASGFSVTRDTVTSVLAGKANTATTSINASQANFIRHPPPPSVNLATTYAIPNNHPDPFIHSVNLPTSYPLHIAGTTAQNMISKSPLEMVQNVIGGSPSKSEGLQMHLNQISRKVKSMAPNKIIISSTGQVIANNVPMPPPPPKTSTPVQMNASNASSMTQVVPSIQSVNQPAVVVNTLQAPFVIQPSMMSVDGQVMQQNTVLPQIVAGGQMNDGQRQIDIKSGQSFVQGVAMLSPESLKKKKKRKTNAAVTNVLQITAPQQNAGNIMVHHTSPQHNTSPQFSPRGFQLSPNNNISPPILQALTIVPGKSGTPAHIVMNGQSNNNNFGSQQIITNTSPSQQINLLQPVNLINNASNVVSNFPAFQQFIVPNIQGMVMTADGTIIQDNANGVQMQLQLQNVLTPVQNPGVFTGTNTGVVLRTQNQQGKIIQSQHSPGAQFLSPNSQVMMNSPNFNGQLSPLLANVSPTNVTFNTNPQIRSGNMQTQEFIQTNQMGQTLMVPLSPKQVSIATSRSNSTFVQQNTTIVQQQTTLVSNSHNTHATSLASNLQSGNSARLSIDPNILLNASHKQINKVQQRNFIEMQPEKQDNKIDDGYAFMNEFDMLGEGSADFNHIRHSVSTQTLVNRTVGAGQGLEDKSPGRNAPGGASSPPDTTTHSPLGPEASTSPALQSRPRPLPHTNMADTTTSSPEPADANSSAMVQCVSSSEQDIADSREHAAWSSASNEFGTESDTQSLMSNIQLMRQHRHPHNPVESTDIHFSNMNSQINQQLPSYYEMQSYQHKRKNEFGDAPYRGNKIMRTNYNMLHGAPTENEYNLGVDKTPKRHYNTSSGTEVHKVFDRLGNDTTDRKSPEGNTNKSKFSCGDLIWGPVKGYASWPGKLVGRTDDGKWNVRWFGGDKAPGFVEDGRLLTLSEGLEAHHAARIKHRKSRKLNTHLENAIQEAMNELDKKSDVKTELEDVPTTAVEGSTEITETPKRNRKSKGKKHGGLSKTASKEGAKLRSCR